MRGEKEEQKAEKNLKVKTANEHRKRINRIKTAIIVIIIILAILPTISCIYLGIQMSRLQKQVDDLLNMHGISSMSYEDTKKGENYAYAAEYPGPETDDNSDVSENNSEKNQPSNSSEDTNKSVLTSDNRKENNTEQSTPSDKKNSTKTGKDREQGNEIEILNTGKYIGKKVYLTFDDGPSIYTDDILDILAKYHVKATFFVVGKTDSYSKKMYQRIVKEGHTLGMHSYSHIYKQIYNSVEDFDKDFTKLWNLLYDTTGYKPAIYRFPGGSANLVNEYGMDEFISYLNEHSIVYYDWNVENGDATGTEYTKEQLIDKVLNGVSIKETSIVLMHDSETKATTKDSLPELLKTLISEGAEILPLDKDVKPIQQIKSDSIK